MTDVKYRKNVDRIMTETSIDEETAMAMLLLTATLMDLCPWDSEAADIVISDCKRTRNVDLRESEPCAG